MPLPRTKEELEAMGYRFKGRSICRSANCGQQIAWYTTPEGKYMPFDEGSLEVHWATCPDAEKFKRE